MANLNVRTVGTYINVMELLVKEEIEQQLGMLQARSPRFLNQINQVELVALSLNQLPALYATSNKGLDLQRQKGKAKYASQIKQVVHNALATVLRDPLRNSDLQVQGADALQGTLRELRSILNNEAINWDNLPIAVERAIKQAKEGTVSRSSRQAVYAAARTPGFRRPSSESENTVIQVQQPGDSYAWGDFYR
jgi:hypothetical protein